MKKLIYLFVLGLGFTSCSVESMDSTENLLTADLKFKTQSAVTITPPAGLLCVGEELVFAVNVNTTKNFQVQQLIQGEWEQVHLANQGQSGDATFTVILLEGENFFRHTDQTGGGFTNYTSSFTGVVCNTCENLLVAELSCGTTNTASFTFTAVEAGAIVIQGGLTHGTEIISATSDGLTQNTAHQGTENAKANVTRWEGNVEACQVVTVTIEFTGGNGIGDWSAKRGDDVLGSTKEQSCNNE